MATLLRQMEADEMAFVGYTDSIASCYDHGMREIGRYGWRSLCSKKNPLDKTDEILQEYLTRSSGIEFFPPRDERRAPSLRSYAAHWELLRIKRERRWELENDSDWCGDDAQDASEEGEEERSVREEEGLWILISRSYKQMQPNRSKQCLSPCVVIGNWKLPLFSPASPAAFCRY